MNKFFFFFFVLISLFSLEAKAQGYWAPGPMSVTPNIEMCDADQPFAEIRKSGTGNGATRVVCDAEFGSSRTIYKLRPSDKYAIMHGSVVIRDAYGYVKFIGLQFTVNMVPWSINNGDTVLMVGVDHGRVSMYYQDPESGVMFAARRWSLLGCLLPNFQMLKTVN